MLFILFFFLWFNSHLTIRIVMACQQFRTRDCKNLDVLLFSGTAPIIETSNHLRLGCFRFAYFSLEGGICYCFFFHIYCSFSMNIKREKEREKKRTILFSVLTSYHPNLHGIAQFEAANISVWNNVWSQIHDFSGSGHWQCLPEVT